MGLKLLLVWSAAILSTKTMPLADHVCCLSAVARVARCRQDCRCRAPKASLPAGAARLSPAPSWTQLNCLTRLCAIPARAACEDVEPVCLDSVRPVDPNAVRGPAAWLSHPSASASAAAGHVQPFPGHVVSISNAAAGAVPTTDPGRAACARRNRIRKDSRTAREVC